MSDERDRRVAAGVHFGVGASDQERASLSAGRRVVTIAPAAAVLAAAVLAVALLAQACSSDITPGGTPAGGTRLLEPDAGWVSAGGVGFQPVPFKHPASAGTGGSKLVGATGSEARVKWIADRAAIANPEDSRSTLSVRVVDVTDPTARADIVVHGAGGAGFADLPIEPGKRTIYRLTWTAVGTYRWCSAVIEVRTQ